jgi:hypothetical protein
LHFFDAIVTLTYQKYTVLKIGMRMTLFTLMSLFLENICACRGCAAGFGGGRGTQGRDDLLLEGKGEIRALPGGAQGQ